MVIAAVVVVALVLRHVDVVQHDAHQVAADLLDQLLGADVHRLRIAAVLDDLQGHIHFAGEDRGVADAHDRRGIEEHEIVALLQFADQILHLGGAQNAQRTAGQLAARQEIQRRQAGGLDHFLQRVLLQQVVGEPEVVGHVQHLVQRRAAQVGVHHQDALPALGEDRGEVEDGGGFAFAGAGADDGDGVELVVLAREQQVGAQDAVGLRVRAFRPLVHEQARHSAE